MKRKIINVKKIIQKFDLEIVNNNQELEYRNIYHPAVIQLGLELAGQIQSIKYRRNVICWGSNENDFFIKIGKEKAIETIENVLKVCPPFLILSSGIKPQQKKWILPIANKYKIPVYCANYPTATIMTTIGTYLSDFFSEEVQVHGCLISIGGTGVLIVGKSGVGKSEATLELLQRGHIFVSDDAVLIKHIGGNYYGTSPKLTRNFIEVRGIGLIDIKYTYGIKSIMQGVVIDLVVELIAANEKVNFDRLGIEYLHYPILDGSIVKTQIPVRNGFSAASLIEAAVSTYLARKDGFNVLEQIEKRKETSDV